MPRYSDTEKLKEWVKEFHPADAYWALSMLENAPIADVMEIKHGHWQQNPHFKSIYYCSECGRHIESAIEPSEDTFPFCHCGAKMDERSDV